MRTPRLLRGTAAFLLAVGALFSAHARAGASPEVGTRPPTAIGWRPATRSSPAGFVLDRARFEPLDPSSPLTVVGLGAYRGAVELRGGGNGLSIVDELGVEEYVQGISEMPSDWPPAALQAQAIAARTYALNRMLASGRGAGDAAPLCATDACQVYAGVAKETGPHGAEWVAAVRATRGLVLDWRGQPILAEYSSSNGGRSVDGGLPYLRAVDDPDDARSPLHQWTDSVSSADLAAALGLSGPVRSIGRSGDTVAMSFVAGTPPTTTAPAVTTTPPTSASDGVLPASTEPTSTAPTTTVPPPPTPPPTGTAVFGVDDFMHRVNQNLPGPGGLPLVLPSARFGVGEDAGGATVTFSGIGFGHGVGMSQYGALGKALRGMSAADILAAYYGGLRPTPATTPDPVVRVGVGAGLGDSGVEGRFRLLDGAGRAWAVAGSGHWDVRPGPGGTVLVIPPAGWDAPFGVDVLGTDAPELVPGAPVTVRFRLPVAALVTVVATPPGEPAVALPNRLADAGFDDTVLPAPRSAGVYHVQIAAVAGVGRAAVAPGAFLVGGSPLSVPDLRGFAPVPGAGRHQAPLHMAVAALAALGLAAVAWLEARFVARDWKGRRRVAIS